MEQQMSVAFELLLKVQKQQQQQNQPQVVSCHSNMYNSSIYNW